jgi:cytochrome P450
MTKALHFENIFEMNYFTNCFSESLRIEPPVTFTSSLMMSEDVQIGKYQIRKGENIEINMYRLHWNPEEW